MKRMTDPMSAPPWPPTHFSLPQLWERIAAMFAVLMREARSIAYLAARTNSTRLERHAIRCRLEPLEKLVRSLLITEALIRLLMTPQGRELIAAATPMKPPAPRTQTHAQRPPAAIMQKPDKPQPFRVLAWQTLHEEDDNTPLSPPPKPSGPCARAPGGPVSTRHLARRIDTLARVLNDPEPAIARLAKFIAALPRDLLDTPVTLAATSQGWWHGRPEYFNAIALEHRAVIAFHRDAALREEPG